MPAMFLAV